jgi:hypothetical protein
VTLQPTLWYCADCLQRIQRLALATEIQRVLEQADRILREAA